MDSYISKHGRGLGFILLMTALYNILILILLQINNSYIVGNLLGIILWACNIYGVYYMILYSTIKCTIDDKNLTIYSVRIFKKITIPLNKVEGYNTSTGEIKGVRLYGISSNSFAMGRFVIDKIGIARMFVTDNKKIFYIKTKRMNYAVSPKDDKKFEENLINNNIQLAEWESKVNNSYNLHKDKHFILPLIGVSITILILTLNPFILYLKDSIPNVMPLSFDAKFHPIKMGTGQQFAFTQMIYGVLNMVLLFCMYYASYFCAKYDRKSAYKYIYLSLIVAIIFLIMQFKILINFS
jgi:hypothetical protein